MTNTLLVFGQFLAMLICVIPYAGMAVYNPVWWGISLLGAIVAGWALMFNRPGNFHIAPKAKAGAQLATAGPYRYVRHPMYSAVFLIMAGLALAAGHWLNLVGFLLVVGVFVIKMQVEERNLREHFGEPWAQYAADRKRVIPGVY